MAKSTLAELNNAIYNKSVQEPIEDLIDSVSLLTPGVNILPTSDPEQAGALFVTESTSMGLGEVTGSGFKIFCVSQG